jgi:triacylglycerol esterase/lipase EstA (alpha/beta hydrolase family)
LVLTVSVDGVQRSLKEVWAHAKALKAYPFGVVKVGEYAQHHMDSMVNPRPVLLVHGIIHNRSAFFPLKRELQKWGFQNIFTMNYSTRHGSVMGMVEEVSVEVKKILDRTGASQVDIVAHSLGGLVSRYFMSVGEGRGKVNTLITIGSAHHGTKASVLLRPMLSGSISRDLQDGSYFINSMQMMEPSWDSKIVSIYSPTDWTVWPRNSCLLKESPSGRYKNISDVFYITCHLYFSHKLSP